MFSHLKKLYEATVLSFDTCHIDILDFSDFIPLLFNSCVKLDYLTEYQTRFS
jgi:hypothetical protein